MDEPVPIAQEVLHVDEGDTPATAIPEEPLIEHAQNEQEPSNVVEVLESKGGEEQPVGAVKKRPGRKRKDETMKNVVPADATPRTMEMRSIRIRTRVESYAENDDDDDDDDDEEEEEERLGRDEFKHKEEENDDAVAEKEKKKRGRKRKDLEDNEDHGDAKAKNQALEGASVDVNKGEGGNVVSVPKRKRGRPKLNPNGDKRGDANAQGSNDGVQKKKRGGKKKQENEVLVADVAVEIAEESQQESTLPRRSGLRTRKVNVQTEESKGKKKKEAKVKQLLSSLVVLFM